MSTENFSGKIPTETLAIKFIEKNYAAWEFQFKMFLKGKDLWSHIDGSSTAPVDAKKLRQWETKDAQIISWILGSIEAYMPDDFNERLRLVTSVKVPKENLASIQVVHEDSRRDQFLMKQRSDFEVAWAGLLNRNLIPSLSICLGQGKTISSLWFVDSGASNHTTGSPDLLHNLRQYTGTQNIQIANGSNLPIIVIGDIGSSFRHVFVSPGLSTSLISDGQLVDNNCDVSFSRGGYIVQD
ncbi:hypothetical protein L6164_026244 [Bauhinia variegata]|uniref:Uncharacterized protein n=1 Tax=Bauhinia variegata TaxID=167791 RepID=A0ACB9LQ46_BAUVA|nr:hypothetical protein L6164_026244 [Bauhinia variegata]